MKLTADKLQKHEISLTWEAVEGCREYRLFWADADTPHMNYKELYRGGARRFTAKKSTHIPQYFYVEAWKDGRCSDKSRTLKTPVACRRNEQTEQLGRGLIAVTTPDGIFLAWRLFKAEATGWNASGLTGTDFLLYRNGRPIAEVTDSTNYLDREGTETDAYCVAARRGSQVEPPCAEVRAFPGGVPYLELPLTKPADGVTPAGEPYTYSANDMSVGDADGDGEYEFFVKWDPSNSHDNSHKGYTGNCYIDCYKLDGRLLWRLDLGCNIRAGAHYTQFMVYDFDGDGKAELAVKTAPGTKMTRYLPPDAQAVRGTHGGIASERYITLPERDVRNGVTHRDSYVLRAEDYYEHLVRLFLGWREHPEVKRGAWPDTLEACFGIEPTYPYPLSREDAMRLADHFLDVYAPSRHPKNNLRDFEGFILEGPEYLTMFAGDGRELETIDFPVPRDDDGLLWGDYAWTRIEPGNRVDRFLSGVAYLDGERPYLIVCRGYYTRATITAYRFFSGHLKEQFRIDSGYVPMDNPFAHHSSSDGTDPVYGCLAGQGNHSLSVADVDGDGCHEIIYGAAVIDHDGSLLYSGRGKMPDGQVRKLGHGDAMHVANIDPDRPGLEVFHVFEGGSSVPYGWALQDAETGELLFGERADRDLGRCMIGDIAPGVRGLQVWATKVYDCRGNRLPLPPPGTNFSIRWAADLSTQILDGADYLHGPHTGVIADPTHGVMLRPDGTLTNNGTKGTPALVADIFGDFREELLLRTEDSRAIRIYTNTELTTHKLFTLMHDTTYRCGVAWQNNCYNQPCYPGFYYASDMDFGLVLRELT